VPHHSGAIINGVGGQIMAEDKPEWFMGDGAQTRFIIG
jgi:hypothetical protein